MTGPVGTKCHQIFISFIPHLSFPFCWLNSPVCFLRSWQYNFQKLRLISSQFINSYRKRAPFSQQHLKKKALRICETRSTWIMSSYLNTRSQPCGQGKKCRFIARAGAGGISTTQNKWQQCEKVSSPQENQSALTGGQKNSSKASKTSRHATYSA